MTEIDGCLTWVRSESTEPSRTPVSLVPVGGFRRRRVDRLQFGEPGTCLFRPHGTDLDTTPVCLQGRDVHGNEGQIGDGDPGRDLDWRRVLTGKQSRSDKGGEVEGKEESL